MKEWQHKLHEIIYEADTFAGKLFDILLLALILLSVVLVSLESIQSVDEIYHNYINIAEWIITILFTLEYIARLSCVTNPGKYIFSFFGLIDLFSTLPKYLSLLFFVFTKV